MNYLKIIFCTAVIAFSTVMLTSCGTPTMSSIDHDPPAHLTQTLARPVTVCIPLPIDVRQDKSITPLSIKFLLPLVPYSSMHNGESISASDRLPSSPFSPTIETSILQKIVTKYMCRTQLFETATSPQQVGKQNFTPPDSADYVMLCRVQKWESDFFVITYGLSCLGAFPAWGIGLPYDAKKGEYDITYELYDIGGKKTILSKNYNRKLSGAPGALPWGYMFYGWAYDELFEDLNNALREDLTDFTELVNKTLPPASDTAFYNKLKYNKAIRIADKAGNDSSIFSPVNIYPADKASIRQRYIKPGGYIESQLPLTKVTVLLNSTELKLPHSYKNNLRFNMRTIPELKLVDGENSLEIYLETIKGRKYGFEYTIQKTK